MGLHLYIHQPTRIQVMPRHTLHATTIRHVVGITATGDAIVSSDRSAPERICIENRVVAQHFLAPQETNQNWAGSKEICQHKSKTELQKSHWVGSKHMYITCLGLSFDEVFDGHITMKARVKSTQKRCKKRYKRCKNPPTPAFAKAGAAPGTTASVELVFLSNRHPKATSMASYGRPSLPFARP